MIPLQIDSKDSIGDFSPVPFVAVHFDSVRLAETEAMGEEREKTDLRLLVRVPDCQTEIYHDEAPLAYSVE